MLHIFQTLSYGCSSLDYGPDEAYDSYDQKLSSIYMLEDNMSRWVEVSALVSATADA